jgi:Fe2+ transport system protein B
LGQWTSFPKVIHFTIEGSKKLFYKGSWVPKDAEFHVDFKNIKCPLWKNVPTKIYSRIKNFLYRGGI